MVAQHGRHRTIGQQAHRKRNDAQPVEQGFDVPGNGPGQRQNDLLGRGLPYALHQLVFVPSRSREFWRLFPRQNDALDLVQAKSGKQIAPSELGQLALRSDHHHTPPADRAGDKRRAKTSFPQPARDEKAGASDREEADDRATRCVTAGFEQKQHDREDESSEAPAGQDPPAVEFVVQQLVQPVETEEMRDQDIGETRHQTEPGIERAVGGASKRTLIGNAADGARCDDDREVDGREQGFDEAERDRQTDPRSAFDRRYRLTRIGQIGHKSPPGSVRDPDSMSIVP